MDFRALARAITAVEQGDSRPLRDLRPGKGLVAGITGPPGAGKSSLVDALAEQARRLGKTVAILAIDPSSRATGGAILGDRIRMQRHHADPGVFIRSMATRGASGGVAAATRNAARVLRGSGFDLTFIETVGVGQDEIAVASVADVVALVLVPGMGDDVQAIKAGIMEIADLFVINKADYPGADRTAQDIDAMLSLGHAPKPPILQTVATEGRGVAELLETLESLPRRTHPTMGSVVIDHLGIAVHAIEAALPFYQTVGLRSSATELVPQENVRVSLLPVGEARVELLEPAAPDSPISKFLEKRGPGLHHVALRVPDLTAAAAAIEAAGGRLLNRPQRGAGGHLYVFVHPASTGGVLWELVQQEGETGAF